jgi:predicted alpha/beta-hydrolase family hydrolase
MKKTVFANWGSSNQGKSDTVKKIAQEILLHWPNAVANIPLNLNAADIKLVITIGKIVIGIESQGDPNSRLFKSIAEFAAMGCHIIICATRTSGATVDAVSALDASHGYEIIWFTNYRSDKKSRDLINSKSAKHIVDLLADVIAGKI